MAKYTFTMDEPTDDERRARVLPNLWVTVQEDETITLTKAELRALIVETLEAMPSDEPDEPTVTITKAQLRKLVKAAMTTDSTYGPVCHVCGAILVNTNGRHHPDCELSALEELCK